MENKEKIAFIEKKIEQIEYNMKSYARLAKSSADSLATWNEKIQESEKEKQILEEALGSYKIMRRRRISHSQALDQILFKTT